MNGRAAFWLGALVGGVLAGAVLFAVFWLPRAGLAATGEPLRFTLVLTEAHGLRAGAPVRVAGLDAGEVRSVALVELPERGWRVLAEVEIFDSARFEPMLRLDSVYQLSRAGLLGDVGLAVIPGGAGGSVRGQLVDAEIPAGMDGLVRDLGHIATRLADFLDGRRPGDPNLRRALLDLQQTVQQLRVFTERLP